MICNKCGSGGITHNGLCKDCEKDQMIGLVINRLTTAAPDDLNRGCNNLRQRGGKFEVLARVLMGELSIEQAHDKIDALEQEA